jgi:hypothetical protein
MTVHDHLQLTNYGWFLPCHIIPYLGSDVIPDTVHHVVCRVDPSKPLKLPQGQEAPYPAITDEVHLKQQLQRGNSSSSSSSGSSSSSSSPAEEISQRVKERKQHLLVHLVDKYEVSSWDDGAIVVL